MLYGEIYADQGPCRYIKTFTLRKKDPTGSRSDIIQIEFKYEWLQEFCGQIGHLQRECMEEKADTIKRTRNFEYGAWMQAIGSRWGQRTSKVMGSESSSKSCLLRKENRFSKSQASGPEMALVAKCSPTINEKTLPLNFVILAETDREDLKNTVVYEDTVLIADNKGKYSSNLISNPCM